MSESGHALHVLVGVLGDGEGRWLLSSRRAGGELAEYWEFPGGKRRAGEQPLAALERELAEELGIELLAAEPLLDYTYDYPARRVRLDVWRVLRYRGAPTAREGQRLRWLRTDELAAAPLLPADSAILAVLPAAPSDQQIASIKRTS